MKKITLIDVFEAACQVAIISFFMCRQEAKKAKVLAEIRKPMTTEDKKVIEAWATKTKSEYGTNV